MSNKTPTDTVAEGSTLKTLSLKEHIAYGVGDFGSNLFLCIGTLYLLKFYTDVLYILKSAKPTTR